MGDSIKIRYTYSTKVMIKFDEMFEVYMSGSLDEVANKIRWCMEEYGFDHADVIDTTTGEILIMAEYEEEGE